MAKRVEDPAKPDRPAHAGWAEFLGRRIFVLEDSVLVAAEITANLSQAGALVIGPHLDVPAALEALSWDGAPIDGAILSPVAKETPTDAVAERLLEKGVRFVMVAGFEWSGALPPAFQAAPICRRPLMIEELFTHLSGCLKGE